MQLFTTILGAHVVVDTVDKFSAKSQTTTVSIPTGVTQVSASTDGVPPIPSGTDY